MKALDKKVFRDLARMKGQSVAIGLVICCGIAIYIAWRTTYVSLDNGLRKYYQEQRFGDIFVSLKRAPLSLLPRLLEIPGVQTAEARIVEFVNLDIPTLNEPASGKLISLPDHNQPTLNGLHLSSGRMPDADRSGEIVAEEAFVAANGFDVGDKIDAVMNGKRQSLHIVGIAMSPEFITTAQPGSLFPDDRRFGIFWMRRAQMENAFDMESAFNDVVLSLIPGESADPVILELDQLLERYGGLGAVGRDRQLSHRFISDELTQLKIMTLVPPSIFLGVAAFLLNVVIRRMLAMQRPQIATLKAFGFTTREIEFHYAKLIGIIILSSALAGCILGTVMGEAVTNLYIEFYRFPEAVFQLSPSAYVIGVILGTASGFVGVYLALNRAVKIPPAEAMRPESPPVYRRTLFERKQWDRFLSRNFRMTLREFVRRPVKACLTSLGIALACAVIVVGNFGKDAIDFLVDFQFGLQQRQDATVNFTHALPAHVASNLKNIDGVLRVEPFRSVPVKLVSGQYSRQLGVMGVTRQRELFRLLDESGHTVDLPETGLVISSQLAEILHAGLGEEITLEVLENDRPVRKAVVVALINDFSGTSAYMNLDALNRLMREQPTISGAFLALDILREDSAYRELKDIPTISAVNLHRAAFEGFMESFGENMLTFRYINAMFACVIAVGVVYNSAIVTLSERSRELTTLRVIGFTRKEVSTILLSELACLVAVAIPVGWLIGYGLCLALVESLPTEYMRIPMILSPATFAFAAAIILAASVMSGIIVRRGIDRLDLVSVLK